MQKVATDSGRAIAPPLQQSLPHHQHSIRRDAAVLTSLIVAPGVKSTHSHTTAVPTAATA